MMTDFGKPDALAPTRKRHQTAMVSKVRWTPEEDQRLLNFLAAGGRANWTELVPHFPGKTAQQISERWSKVLDPSLVKRSWTRVEDETIIEFVAQFGTRNWTKLAELLPGRIGKQCRERWRNHLDPCNSKEPWTPEEDQLLIRLHEEYGNQWVKIATLMPGRSDNHIKNRWNSKLKKQIECVSANYTTPRKGSRKIETPKSSEHYLPKPNLETIAKASEPAATPTFTFTPHMDFVSPAMDERSPMLFGSPFMEMRPALSPFHDPMRTPGRDSFFASPTLARSFEQEMFGSMD